MRSLKAKKILWCCLLSTLIFTNAGIGCADTPHQQVRHNGSYSAVQAPEKTLPVRLGWKIYSVHKMILQLMQQKYILLRVQEQNGIFMEQDKY